MKKQYIFILLFVSNLILGQTPTGTSQEVGITEGQLSVSLSGGATYSFSIAVPLGINGVVPQVGLSYNSQAGNGIAGYGWNISGVSAITRIPRTKFHDGVAGGVNLDANDRFAFDGQRLILKTGTAYGAAGTTYETENFSTLKISAVGVSPLGANYGPASFKVEYPDGSVAYYGDDSGSRSITTWGITYWENPQGMRISYTYLSTDLTYNNLTIEYIKYGGVSTGTHFNQIKFIYQTRKRSEQSYVGGQLVLRNTILNEIKVSSNVNGNIGTGFRSYSLIYNTAYLGYQTLKNITETSGDGTSSYNPTSFTYEISENKISLSSAIPSGLPNTRFDNTATISGDFDGDGIMDFVAYPIIGANAKKKFWLYNNINNNNGSINPIEEISGSFDDIFSSTWLDFSNKMGDRQGIIAIQRVPNLRIDFNTYVANNYGGVGVMYAKQVFFPTNLVSSYGFYDNVVLEKKYLSGDFNGDGLTDIVAIDKKDSSIDYTNKVFFIDLDSRKTTNFWNQAGVLSNDFLNSDRIEAMDINGDGKTDIIHFTNGSLKAYTLNDANLLTLLWSKTDSNIITDQPILLGDYNGDGKMDFIIPTSTGSYSPFYSKFLSTGNGLVKTSETYPFHNEGSGQAEGGGGTYTTNLIPLDINGDGKTDIVSFKSLFATASGSGTIIITSFQNDVNSFDSAFKLESDTIFDSAIIDFPVPIFLSPNTNNQYYEIAAMSGSKLFTFTSKKDFSKERLLNTITTGNGVTESITYKPLQQDPYETIYTPSPYLSVYPNIDINVAPNFKVVSKLEKRSQSTYKKQLFSYAGASSNMEGLGFLGFRGAMRTNWFDDTSTEPSTSQIISSISKFDPSLRGANVASYTYLGLYNPTIAVNTAAPNTPRKSAITINDARTGTETIVATNSIRFLPGATISPTGTNSFKAQITPDYDANGFAETNTTPPTNLISKSLSFYETSLSATKVYTLQNTQSNTYNILDNTSSETVTVYDSYNNPTESISKIRNGGTGEQTTKTSIAYKTPLTTPYLIGRPDSKIQTVSSIGDTMMSKEVYGYGTGTESNLLKKIEKWGNNTNVLTEDNIYDSLGNITKKTITANGLTPRVTNYEYNPASPYNGRFLTKSIDIEGLETVFTYNCDNGNLMTELLPSKPGYPLLTTYVYNDPWFKKTKTIDYLGKSNTYAYSRINSVNTLVTATGDDGSYSEELFDDLGRKIKSGVRDISGVAISFVSYLFDTYDRNIKVSEPYFGAGATQWNETKYDEYGRTSQNISFTTKTVSVDYLGLTTTVDDGTKTKKSLKNAIGNVVRMTDQPGGIIDYTYFANGNLKTTSYGGVITTIEQDGWGRKTKLTEPSAGNYTYAYNDFGETTSETTPNGTTTYALNAVGKLTTKTISGNNTNSSTVYNYNSTTKLLDSSIFTNTLEAGAVTTNTFTYDNYKRLVGTSEVTPYATFIKTIDKFDDFGRVEKETTSGTAHGKTSSKTIKNTYLNGYAWKILSDDVTPILLWQTNTVNARGQLLMADLGNGIAITNEYDPFGFAKEFKHDKTGSNPANIMKLQTTFDEKKGNLKSRNHNIFNWLEDFTTSYDELDRLTSYKNAQGVVVTQTYNEDGRIDVNTLGKYYYTNTAKKYQNTSITLTPDARTYYQNRGIAAIPSPTAARALNITYNTFKSPVEIKEDGVDNLSFVYNDNNDRSTMFYGSTNPDKNLRPNRKYYSADGSMEIKATFAPGNTTNPTAVEFVTYIGGDGYSAPIVLKSDGTTQNYLYLHRDYQGSILVITDANAIVLEKRLFDAWGAILKVQNGAGVDLNVLTILDRGYTGHEHLQSVGLINMNGRIYDPKLHRFLQPDNFVQDPSNTQSYNRYAYCWNNPLKYSDPSGEFLFLAPLIYAAVNVGVDLIRSGGKMNFGQIAMSFAQGALNGYLGGATSIGGAFLGAAVGQLNKFMPAITLYQSSGFNLSISPFIGFGSSGFSSGVSLNASGQIGDFAYSANVGFGTNQGTSSLGEASGTSNFWNAGGFAGYNDGHANYGLGYSYNSFDGKSGQGVGAVTIQAGDFGFRLDEDAFIGDNGDRSRTGGMLMTYRVNGDLTLAFGASMMTGEATGDDDHTQGNPNYYKSGPNQGRMVGTHRGEINPNLRAGTMYGGIIYKGQASFYGHNSEKRLHSVQNWIHKNVVHYTPYFADRGFSSRPYTYSGSYHSSYLYY